MIFAEPIHKFIKVLKDSQADEASSVTLLCETAQTPSTVKWLKGHAELKNGGRYEMSQKEQVMTLTIKELEEEDTDMYTCDVATAKSTAKVIVNGKKIWIYCMTVLHALKSLNGTVNQSVPFKDTHHSSVTTHMAEKKLCVIKLPMISRFACEKIVLFSNNFVFQTLAVDVCSTLVFLYCHQSQCIILALPVNFEEELKNQEKTKGETARLCCKLSKPVAVQWKKGSEYLTPGEKYEMKQRETLCELFVKDLKVEDSGEYSCVCREQKTLATVKVSGMESSGIVHICKNHFC